MDTKAILLKAADLIEEKGLSHTRFQDKSGCLCVVGAIGTAFGHNVMDVSGTPWWGSDTREVLMAFKKYLGLPYRNKLMSELLDWNDRSSKEKVITALRNCAHSL